MTSPNTIIADLTAEVETLRKQRDELLAALEWLNSASANGFLYGDPARVNARNVIAKIKGGS